MQRIYLDNASSTKIDVNVTKELKKITKEIYGNPSSNHYFGQKLHSEIESFRTKIMDFFQYYNAKILFFASGTESLNMLIFNSLKDLPSGSIVVSTKMEHTAILEPLKFWTNHFCHQLIYLQTSVGEVISADLLEEFVANNECAACFCSWVQHDTGIVVDMKKLSAVALSANVTLIVDAIAAFGKIPITLHSGITSLVISLHKAHGLIGCSIVLLSDTVSYDPLIRGGGQEFGLHSGTENYVSILGNRPIFDHLKENIKKDMAHYKKLKIFFEKEMLNKLSDVKINGIGDSTHAVSNLFFKGIDGNTLTIRLDLRGVAASIGAACSSRMRFSSSLVAMGYSETRAKSSIRFSFGRFTSKKEVGLAIQIIKEEVNKLRDISQ